jgi:hypothetical protein
MMKQIYWNPNVKFKCEFSLVNTLIFVKQKYLFVAQDMVTFFVSIAICTS